MPLIALNAGGAKAKGHSAAREAAGSPAASDGGEYQVERVLKKLWKPTSKSGGARGDEAPTKIKLSGGLVPCYATPKPGDRAFYLVKWVGYDNPSDNSWEPCANLCIEGEYNQVAIDYERQHAEPEDLSGARESQPIRCLRFNSPDPPQARALLRSQQSMQHTWSSARCLTWFGVGAQGCTSGQRFRYRCVSVARLLRFRVRTNYLPQFLCARLAPAAAQLLPA